MTDNPTPFELTKEQLATLLEGDYLFKSSNEDCNTIVKIISTWEEKPCFSNKAITQACLVGKPCLVIEMVKRSHSNFPLEACFPVAMSRMISRVSNEERDQFCVTLLPLISQTKWSFFLREACNENLPKTFKMMFEKSSLSQKEKEDLLTAAMEGSLRDKGFSNPEQEHLSRMKILDVLLPSMEKPLSYDRYLWMASYSGLTYLKQIAPFTDKKAYPKLLVQLLSKDYMVGCEKFKENNHPQMVEFLYQEGKEFFLSYTDDQLELFLPRKIYPFFWEVHTRHRLHDDLYQSVEPALHTSFPLPKKM